MRAPVFNGECDHLLSTSEVAALLGAHKSTVTRAIEAGRYRSRRIVANGGPQFLIEVESLPPPARLKYYRSLVNQQTPAERRAKLEALNLEEQEERQVARLAGVPRKDRKLEALPWTHEEAEAAWEAFDRAPAGVKEEAKRRLAIVRACHAMLMAHDIKGNKVQALAAFADQHNESPATIRRWHDRVKHLQDQRHHWLVALAPKWRGSTERAEFSPEAWEFILAEWGVQSKPALQVVYRRAVKLAQAEGWSLPSYNTVKRRVNKLPEWRKTFLREGVEALSAMFASVERDYSGLGLHDIWCSDGRKADVFVRFEDGTIGRPVVVGWEELRSRYLLGWAVAAVESADVVRASFRNAAERSKALPKEALLDNGMAYAGKLMTGGQKTRYRFKVKEDDIPGILTMLNIDVIWATPGHGQAKPVESFWRTVAQTDKRAEFAGAYCGNRPENKPEEFDPAKAVPLARYVAALQEDIEAYNQRGHRGDSMNGRSPQQVYAELLPATVVRQPTAAQLRLCMLAAESVRLDGTGAFYLLGNRYWSEQAAAQASRGPYVARFDPEDPEQPAALYDGEQFMFNVPVFAKTGFRDQEAAKAHIRARNAWVKAKRAQAKAGTDMDAAKRWDTPGKSAGPATEQQAGMPTPKVASPVRAKPATSRQMRAEDDGGEMDPETYRRLRDAALDKQMAEFRQEQEEYPRAASGGR